MATAPTVEATMAFRADMLLKFDDGSFSPCNSTVLSLSSSVLRTALDVCVKNPTADGGCYRHTIPIEGFSRDEWLLVAPFWYPGVKVPEIRGGFDMAELIAKVSNKYDLQASLQQVDSWLAGAVRRHSDAGGIGDERMFRYLQLASTHNLPQTLQAAAALAAKRQHEGCAKKENLLGLSTDTLQQMLVTMSERVSYLSKIINEDGDFQCPCCDMYPGGNVLAWYCGDCKSSKKVDFFVEPSSDWY